ncbi:hypothetical protein QP869_10755, partial [Micrococcus luteus]|nr:hypothetical protein [Micrococcus luteus]MDK8730294.1 hypothetical protein [Micrococcus luteus]
MDEPHEPASEKTVSAKEVGRIARAAFVGTALEWYDYYLFGTAAALVFNRLFWSSPWKWCNRLRGGGGLSRSGLQGRH